MKMAIYDASDLELCTVIDVPPSLLRMVEKENVDVLRFACEIEVRPTFDNVPMEYTPWPMCEVRFHEIRFGDLSTWIGTVNDGEMALKLRSEFLPGQQREVNRVYHKGFVTGLLRAYGL